MNFNPEEYETVKSRKDKFYEKYPEGSIIVELLNLESINTHAVFKASVFETKQDQEKNLPRGIGYALEIRDKEKSISKSGKEYESINYTSWTENCEESAVGRALDNAGYSGNKKASREEMVKAQAHAERFSESQPEGTKEYTYEPVTDPNTCSHPDFLVNTVKKEGPNKGKKFKSCKACKRFIGWYTETKEEDLEDINF